MTPIHGPSSHEAYRREARQSRGKIAVSTLHDDLQVIMANVEAGHQLITQRSGQTNKKMITYISPKKDKRKQRIQDALFIAGAIAFFLLLLIGTAPANR